MTNYKYFNFDKSPWVSYECYFISGSTEVWELFTQCPHHDTSLFGIQVFEAALFGLKPEDFYNYIALVYNAHVLRSDKLIWRKIFFDNIKDANIFVKELNRRMEFAVKHKFFEGQYGQEV